MYRLLSTKETVLDKKQLKEYLTKLASDNVIKETSDINTYPIPRVLDNFKYISLIYTLLNEHVKLEIPIHPAGEWLLDNYYLIENTVRILQKDLSKEKYKKFPRIATGNFAGFARIFVLANEIVMNTDGRIDEEELKEYLMAYQAQKNLFMEEIWNLGLFLEISIIEKIRGIAEKIFSSQMQKYKVENIVERIIENKDIRKIKLDVDLYPFIEYMSYRLRVYGKKGNAYLEILEEQVKKHGMTVTDVINKEHFDIALKRVSMKNCISSIKKISRMDILDIFENVSIVEKILEEDEVYKKMDYQTKALYRSEIQKLAKKTHSSEVYIANKCLELTKGKSKKESHIGYYIIADGRQKLLNDLLNRKVFKLKNTTKAKLYIFSIYFFTILFTLLIATKSWIIAILSFIPMQNVVTQFIQYILSKIIKPKPIPKIDFEETGIPKEYTTMCVIPVLLKNTDDVEKMMKKLEVYYLANKGPNLYFTLLGDCSSEKIETKEKDILIINKGKEYVEKLNKKYGGIFNFIYRKREWCSSERCYMGWERKRGLLNQLNEFLLTGKDNFLVNTCKNLPKIKYIITLDSDTKLVLGTAEKLVGAMAHILNKPEVNKIINTVCSGHALIQPRIGVNILDERRNIFTRLFSAEGGTDLYTNAISDVYQDNFDEGIYTGKGIYDLDVFNEVLKDVIPENTVLSHDLLEGSFLRCGLASDIVLMDGYPSNYLAYKIRKHRWIRGDVQVLPWIKSTLNALSKYKILDNIVRDLKELFILLIIISILLMTFMTNKNVTCFIILALFFIAFPTNLKLIEMLLNANSNKQELIAKKFSKFQSCIYKFLIELSILPDMAYLEINAFIKSIYRMKISHNFMLEWTTAEEAERNKKEEIKDYYLSMIVNPILGIIFLSANLVFWILGIMWILAPWFMHEFSKKIEETNKGILLDKDKEFLLKEANKTWQFFKDNVVNSLPSDNYQGDRKRKIAPITSPTNIGLYILSTVAAYDLKFEDLPSTIDRLTSTIEVVENLTKWNGHLYNWYNIYTLEPVKPMYISSVDSGNFVGYLYTVKQFLLEKNVEQYDLVKKIDNIIKNTDFSKLYNPKIGLFSIGYNAQDNILTDSYYDLLATEARQTSIVAIAKKDVPSKHWNNLSRTLTKMGLYKGLVSWGGTAFEYLMPNVNIPSYPTTLLDESCLFSILSQKKYAKKLGIPWGISESAYNNKDFKGNYQYKTFGVPWLGLKRGLEAEVVVSPYATALSLMFYPEEAVQNLKVLAKNGVVGKYGFYESIDYKPKMAVNKTFMAHHQGLIFTSIDNLFNNKIFQERFMRNPEMEGVEILLEERMPDNVITTKEKKEKVEKIKYKDYNEYTQRTSGTNVLANGKYTIVMKDDGSSYSKYGNNIISDNMHIYIKDVNSKKVFDAIGKDVKVIFTPSENKLIMQDGNITIIVKVTIVPNLPIEVRSIEIKNTGTTDLTLEVTSYMDLLLASFEGFYAHPTFNKMFIDYEKIDEGIIYTRRTREDKKQSSFFATNLVFDDGDMEFEIDKEKFVSRGNLGMPDAIVNSTQLSKKVATTVQPIIAMRRIVNVKPDELKTLYLINAAGDSKEEATQNLKEYINSESLNRIFEIAKGHTDAETRYLRIKGQDIDIYQKMLEKLLYPEYKNKVNNFEQDFSNEKIWKYGISGDNPILLVKIRDKNDIYLIEEVMKAKEYFDIKNILVDIVVITEEDIKVQNVKILNNISREDKRVLEARANLIIDSKLGALFVQINEESKKELKKEDENLCIKTNETVEIISSEKSLLENMDLLYYNGYGGFTKDGMEYVIMVNKNKKTPSVWCNIMANEKFGTLVTESLGGYTWYKNSKMNRITEFSNDALLDKPSESIFIKDENKIWSIGASPKPDEKNYYIYYGFGYSRFEHNSNDIEQKLNIFIPKEDSLKISLLKLKNTGLAKKSIKIIYDVDFILGEKKNRFINYIYKENLNMVLLKNNLNPNYYTYIISSEKINIKDDKIILDVEIDSLEAKEISIILGCEETELRCIEIGNKYLGSEKEALEDVKKYWKEKVKIIEASTPLDSFNVLQNGWLVYQSIVSRILGKTGFYQSGGAIGYRDQLQDAMNMKYIDPGILKNQILLHAKHQFIEGDVEHWWHNDSLLGIRARYSDDLLWLPYAVITYIEFTGDYSILNENAEYVSGRVLNENEYDYMDVFLPSDKIESIYHHCMRAINKSLDFKDFPKIQGGDWNDGMNKVGEKGIGESVWLGFFLYSILIKFAEFSKHVTRFANKETAIVLNEQNKNVDVKTIGSDEKSDEYERLMEIAERLKRNLNTIGWDGRWYKRAVADDGKVLGSINNKECKIDGISQSWSVISGAGDNDKKYIAMESVEKYLVDKENNLIKLLTPPFENEEFKPGYIASYAPGMRENGGQYTHSAIWCAIAEAILKRNDKMFEMYKMINPIEHSRTEELAIKYKVEPYAVEADIYTADNLAGRGGWTWYTGSSGWMYTLQVEYILGLKINHGILKIEPCIPKEWENFEVKFRWKNAIYDIKYERNKEIKENEYDENNIEMIFENKKVDEIKLDKNGSFNITVKY